MARDKCDPITLLTAVVTRLRSALNIAEAECFISLDPLAKLRSPGDLVFVVSPLSGQFDQGMIEGGGREQVTADTGFTVTIRTYVQLDEAGHDVVALNDRDVGIMQAATDVLSALTLWEPLDASDNLLLRDMLSPSGYEIGKGSGNKNRTETYFQIAFKTVFDWGLSAVSTTTTTTTAAP